MLDLGQEVSCVRHRAPNLRVAMQDETKREQAPCTGSRLGILCSFLGMGFLTFMKKGSFVVPGVL